MYRKRKGLPLLIYGDGEQTRAFSYIDDILPCLWKAGTSPLARNQIINLGGCTSISLNEAAKCLAEVTGGATTVHTQGRHEVKYAWSTYQKSIDLLGYIEKTSLKEGLTKMWEWVQHQPVRPATDMKKHFEVTRGLYSFWSTPPTMKDSEG